MVSPKAQATRHPVIGVLTVGEAQLILQDLPGLLDPAYPLQHAMRRLALDALARADVILHLHPAPEAPAPALASLVPDLADAPPAIRPRSPLVVYTKADLLSPPRREALAATGALLVSTTDRAALDTLVERVAALLPLAPHRHPEDEIGTQPLRFFVGEYLREAAFALLGDELPYAVTAEVDEFREDRTPVYIRATLYVERDSQKGIVIGKGGAMLKQIGAHARARLEALLGTPVFLETWVKVLPRWRRSRGALARFGFPLPEDEGT
jgi:GTP-binding protein Era